MDIPGWCDFGWQMNNALNRIANYAKTNHLSADDVVQMFDVGIAARAVLSRSERDYDDDRKAAA